jgi:hypothetical protein
LIVRIETAHVLFAIHGTSLSPAMSAMHIDHAVFGQLPKPQMKGHRRIANVVCQSLRCFEQNVLNNVTRIDSPRNGVIETHLDHPAHGFTMSIQQAIHCRLIALSDFFQQVLRLFAFWPHCYWSKLKSLRIAGKQMS